MDTTTVMAICGGGGLMGLFAGVGALVKVYLDGRRTQRADAITELYKLVDTLRDEVKGVKVENVTLRADLAASRLDHTNERLRGEQMRGEIRMLRRALRQNNIAVDKWDDTEAEANP